MATDNFLDDFKGGVDAVKELLEKTANRGNQDSKTSGEIRLSPAQRLALEKALNPTANTKSSK